MRYLIFLFGIFSSLLANSQDFHERVNRTYDFSPGRLTEEEQDQKIPQMDGFWELISGDTSQYLGMLRSELARNDNPKFFYFDGGQLLLSLSKSIDDLQLVMAGILKSDVGDINKRSYVGTLNYLARSGINTAAAGRIILEQPEFGFFIPEHAFAFNQSYSLTYCLLPLEPELYVSELIEAFEPSSTSTEQKSIITVLWFSNSCRGNQFLDAVILNEALNSEVRDYAKSLLSAKLKKEKYYKPLHNMQFDELINAQTGSTMRMSDEAVHELDYITKLLRDLGCR